MPSGGGGSQTESFFLLLMLMFVAVGRRRCGGEEGLSSSWLPSCRAVAGEQEQEQEQEHAVRGARPQISFDIVFRDFSIRWRFFDF